jgi:nucleoside-diphosphate-sugar epimerase
LTKAIAEEHVLAAAQAGLDAVIVRPRFIWGLDDTTLLPRLLAAMRAGQWMWLGGGAQLTSTCHVANCVEGLILAAERGKRGEIYFLTDGQPVEVRAFMTALVATQGVTPSDKTISFGAAYALGTVVEGLWSVLRLFGVTKEPPLTRTAVLLMGQEMTVDDAKARRELGYQAKMSQEAGLLEMRASP